MTKQDNAATQPTHAHSRTPANGRSQILLLWMLAVLLVYCITLVQHRRATVSRAWKAVTELVRP